MHSGFKIGRVFGIEIDIDWSWLFIFFLIAWDLGTAFGQVHPTWGAALSWGVAIAAALLFFVSVLLHELAHSLVARSQGIPVRGITLFLFGGVSDIQREPSSAWAEFLIAVVGPITSLVIGLALSALVGISVRPFDTITGSTGLVSQLDPAATVMLWLGSINILLAVFNAIPGFPLDGGRVLRSILWAITGNLRRATWWASVVGQVIAWLFILSGIAMIFGADIPILGSGFINGLWLAFIGWFLNSAAIQSYQQVVVQDILHGVPVSRLMRPNPPTVPSSLTVGGLVHDYAMRTDDYAFPVVEGDRFAGLVTLADVRKVPRSDWDTRTVREIMTPAEKLAVVTPEDDADAAWNQLMSRDVRQLPVLTAGHLAGLFRRSDITRWLHWQSGVNAPTG